ncbi:MAG: hypothetical protein U0U09_18190 [Cyclobacteriaceae bacterium]
MKIWLAAVILYALTALSLHAQDTTRFEFRRDLGFSTNIIFNEIFESSGAPVAIMLKTYNKPGRAMRYGVNLNVSWNDASGDADYSTANQIDLGIVIGKEFQQKIGKSWVWYYGVDVIPGLSYYKYESYLNKDQTSGLKRTSVGFIGRPFLAVRFDINARLYVSAEASFNINYRYSKTTLYFFNPDSTEHLDGHGLALNTTPASGIFIFYRFNK